MSILRTPASDRGPSPSDRPIEADAGLAGPRHILMVDDDEIFREAAAKVLRAAGFEVRLAPDHRLALDLLEGVETIDLLLVDIVMPDRVNGLALARMARLRRRHLKILYLTGYDLSGVESEALGRILRKPIEPDALVAEVKRTLAEAS
jgi:CheY-like chemotaxis protein